MLRDKKVILSGDAILQVLTEIEFMLISLKNIARHYYDNVKNTKDIDPVAYALETTRFIDENSVVYKLAEMRAIISEPLDNELDGDEIEAVEQIMESIKFWQKPGD
jgi:hypothetical protein